MFFFSFHLNWVGVGCENVTHVSHGQICCQTADFSYSCVAVGAGGADAEQCLWLSPRPQKWWLTIGSLWKYQRQIFVIVRWGMSWCANLTGLNDVYVSTILCAVLFVRYHTATQSQTYFRVMTRQVMRPRYLKNTTKLKSSRVINSICQVLNQDYIRREWVDYSFHTSQMPTTC